MSNASDAPLAGRKALVTGAGRGVGRAVAVRLHELGADIVAVSRTESELESLQEQIACRYVVTDLGEQTACEHVADVVSRVDILVNNAAVGSAGEREPWTLSAEQWRAKFAINVDASFHLTRLFVEPMIANGWGRILMVASTAGLTAWPAAAYAASKHAVIGLMRSVALHVGAHGVTCNAVCPGSIRTEMAEQSARSMADARGISAEDIWRERAALYPRGEVLEPDEVAAVIAFLATPAASGINGEAVKVALGGWQ